MMDFGIVSEEELEEVDNSRKGKVVFITGASVGIGRETAYHFARAGWNIAISYNKGKEEAEKTAEKCTDLGAGEVFIVNLDVRKNESIGNAVKEITKKFGKIEVLINNAGVAVWKDLDDQTFDEIEDQIRTNLEGLLKVTKKCLPYIKETIINISSGAGKTGYAGLGVYCATKFGVRGITQSLAGELDNIEVFSVNPGMTSTRMTNFRGVSAEDVGKIIFNTACKEYNVPSGGDVDVWEFL